MKAFPNAPKLTLSELSLSELFLCESLSLCMSLSPHESLCETVASRVHWHVQRDARLAWEANQA